MRDVVLSVVRQTSVADGVYQIVFRSDALPRLRPGQFADFMIDGCYLRRPISVCDADGDTLTVLYKVVGKGTQIMSKLRAGQRVNALLPLGNGYSVPEGIKSAALIGGGIGVPPLYLLAKELLRKDIAVHAVLGFNRAEEAFYTREFEALGCNVTLTTVDGSAGTKGFVTDVLPGIEYDYFYTCGPLPMLRAVYRATGVGGQFSLEERMGCGFGACMGCSFRTTNGDKRICKDGPVFAKEELPWDD